MVTCIHDATGRPDPAEPSDEFFEFTAEDFHRVTAAAGRAAHRREAGLRTAKLRADELRARAARFGPVRLLHVVKVDAPVLVKPSV